MKVKLTCIYEYEGDSEDPEEIVKEEQEALVNGDINVADLLATGTATLTIETLEEPVD